jgi:TatD DNase family protein
MEPSNGFLRMLIDTHSHLDYKDFAADFDAVLERAGRSGVDRMITIATGLESSRMAVALAESHDCIFATVGVHPCHAGDEPESALEEIRSLAGHPRVVAIGEAGFDFFRLPGGPEDNAPANSEKAQEREKNIDRQKVFFEAQLQIAAETGKPIVIHQRASWTHTLETLAKWRGKVRGVMHCFGGSLAQAREVLEMGHLVSFTGIATFKNGQNVRDVARELMPGEFMLETDCPYLAPVPFRGQRCEPCHTLQVAEALAACRGETLAALSSHTTRTAEDFFSLPSPTQ